MKKPVPKELVIVDCSFVRITASSDDARQWIEREAPTFGNLYPPSNYHREYQLFVNDAYDKAEVIAYLESYNSEVVEE